MALRLVKNIREFTCNHIGLSWLYAILNDVESKVATIICKTGKE